MMSCRSCVLLVALVVVALLVGGAPVAARRSHHRHFAQLAQPEVRSHFLAGVPQLEGVSKECLAGCVSASRACTSPCNGALECMGACERTAVTCALGCALNHTEVAKPITVVAERTPVKELTPKEKCLATCVGTGLECAVDCPTTKAGMLTAADLTCRETCALKATACAAQCITPVEETAVQVTVVPVKELTPKEKCLATCAGNGLQCAAECPASVKAGMLTAANDLTCREECAIHAAACATLCVLDADKPAALVKATPVQELTPKEKCLATCAGNGLQCAAECPASVKVGMLTAANDLTCREECAIHATACATLCVLSAEEPAPVSAVPVQELTPKEKCLATCAGNGLQCAAECPASAQPGMLTAAHDISCREECGIKATACATLCVLDADKPAATAVQATPVKELTPKEKCLATCAGNGLQCAAECPASVKVGMLTAANDLTCREECGIRATACATLCVL